MTAKRRPTPDDRIAAIRIALSGVGGGVDLAEVAVQLEPLHAKNDTFPGEVLLELAADAIDDSGASREHPIDFENIRERYLPEFSVHTQAQHHKSKYALRAAAMIRGGVDPGLLDEITWWRTDDLWWWSLEALAAYIRVAADRTGDSVADVCERIAARHGVTLTTPAR